MLDMNEIPSEKYLMDQRRLLFWDEWLFYVVLGLLFFTSHYYVMGLVAVHGALFIAISYRRQWKMERLRFGDDM